MKIRTVKFAVTLASACLLPLLSAGVFAGATRSAPTPTATARPAAPMNAPAGTASQTRSAKSTTTTHRTGQPNASCESTPNPPGNSASAPGSAFNPDGKAGTVYAGEQPQNSRNPKSVSQYDVACTRRSH